MLNTMLLPLIVSLLVLLGAAAPVTDSQDLSDPLRTQTNRCSARYGHHIVLEDCQEVLANMRRLPQFSFSFPLIPNPFSTFSRTSVDGRFRLPQAFTTRTCTIFVGLTRYAVPVSLLQPVIPISAQDVIEGCVHRSHIGGESRRHGITVIVGSEQTLHPSLRAGWDVCKAEVDREQPFDEHAQCLLHDFELDAQAAVERHQGSGNPSTGTE